MATSVVSRSPRADAQLTDAAAAHAGIVRLWLFAIAALVLAMVVVGGATRLTDSGLSITEWQPLLGIIPPLGEADWQAAFAKYKTIPEYHEINAGMSLAEFKFIYWWEWAHRFLGRMIGIAFAVPLAFFWVRGWIERGMRLKLLGVLALGGLQGFFGWYMVQSGLSERVDVSHYRLALHLTTAFLILGSVVWLALDVDRAHASRIRLDTTTRSDRIRAWSILAVMILQVILGAFVAGLKAGLTYNTWPLMDGALIPDGLLTLDPWWLNALENITTVQFNHRVTAYILLAVGIWHALSLIGRTDDERVTRSAAVVAVALVAQAAVGIWTLLATGATGAVPIWLGLLHQGGAAVVLGLVVWHLHTIAATGKS